MTDRDRSGWMDDALEACDQRSRHHIRWPLVRRRDLPTV